MKQRILSVALVFVILAGILSGCYAKPDLKKAGDFYEIHTAEDLVSISSNPTENYILMADIDMEGQHWTPIKDFSGTLDGNGKTIENLTIDSGNSGLGLFANITEDGVVKDLHLVDISVEATNTRSKNVGTFAGTCKGKIMDSSATGIITDSRESVEGKEICVGAFAGKAEGKAKVVGTASVSTTDDAGVYTSQGLSADVKLFVANNENVSYGFVGKTGKNCYVAGLWRDYFHSSERLSDTMRQRQKTVVDYMYKMGTVAWTVPSRMFHKGSHNIHDQIFLPGETYYGIPYDHTAGSYERFMLCMDENNQVKDWVAKDLANSTWSGSDPSLLGFTQYMGNDCSSAVGWAWMQVSPNEVDKDINGVYQGGAFVVLTNEMIPNSTNQELYGIYPVGSWNGEDFSNKDAVYQTALLTKCSEIVAANGEEKIFEAYARARKADGLIYGEPGGHARLIAEDPVVIRKADNSIDTGSSYLLCHEQGDGLYNNRYEESNSSWRINYRYTFDVLMHGSRAFFDEQRHLEAGSGKGYLPITIRALRQEEVPESFVAPYPEIGKEMVITPISGRVYSNFRILSTTVTVKDSTGREVYHEEVFTGSDGVYENFRGANTTVELQDHHSHAMNGLSAGNYTFTVQLTLSDGTNHTVVENQSYNHS